MKEKKCKMKRRKLEAGITLIALIITVVILILVAGISISQISGDGLVSRTLSAREQAQIQGEKETIQAAVVNAKGKNRYGKLTKDELQEELGEEKDAAEVYSNENALIIHFIESNRYYSVDSKGNTEKMDVIMDKNPGNIMLGINGETLDGLTEDTAFEIWCIEDLIEWTKNYSSYQTSYIKLCKDLSFKSELSYGDAKNKSYGDINQDGQEQTIIEEMQTGEGFIPIAQFNGIFDGQNHSIDGIYIKLDTNNVGLFKIFNGILKNCILGKGYIEGNANVGGFIGSSDNVKIYNCKNEASVVSKSRGNVGGIIGYLANTTKSNKIDNCLNNGNIVANGYCGGIIGVGTIRMEGKIQIKNCFNTGDITCTYGPDPTRAKGIGNLPEGSKINNCYTVGTIIKGYTFKSEASADCYCTGQKSSNSNATIISEADMKTQDFVDLLNTVIVTTIDENTGETTTTTSTQDIWAMDTENINNGFPILKWQEKTKQ